MFSHCFFFLWFFDTVIFFFSLLHLPRQIRQNDRYCRWAWKRVAFLNHVRIFPYIYLTVPRHHFFFFFYLASFITTNYTKWWWWVSRHNLPDHHIMWFFFLSSAPRSLFWPNYHSNLIKEWDYVGGRQLREHLISYLRGLLSLPCFFPPSKAPRFWGLFNYDQ